MIEFKEKYVEWIYSDLFHSFYNTQEFNDFAETKLYVLIQF